jgi:predicted transcriptional regulator
MKNGKQLETYFKGAANHRRIDILCVVFQIPNITVEGIAEKLNCDFQVVAVHTQKLSRAGLIYKKYIGRAVAHTISPYGKKFMALMKAL